MELLTLTLVFDIFFQNLNLANNFETVSARALIFRMSIILDKSFLWVHMSTGDLIWNMFVFVYTFFLKHQRQNMLYNDFSLVL